MTALPPNRIKAALARDELQIGLWLTLCDAQIAEMAGRAGFDWALIDAEHGPNTLPAILAQAQAIEAAGAEAVVRVAENDPLRIRQVLDLGIRTILVPMVDTAAEAASAVAASRYPPEGVRGVGAALARASRWGEISDYATMAGSEICILVQAESAVAMENIAEIAATPGVDGVFIGPADLAASMGRLGDPDHPEVRALIEAALAAIRAAGKAPGIVSFDPAAFAEYLRLGVTFLGTGSDATTLSAALRALAGEARGASAR